MDSPHSLSIQILLNTIASIKGGRDSATTVMPLLSAALYLGQFVSPLIVMPMSKGLFGDDITGPYIQRQ